MGVRFRKSIKIAPGIKVNLGKKSAGISIGGKAGGISINSKRGVTARASVPGTGISYSTRVGGGKKSSKKKASDGGYFTEDNTDKKVFSLAKIVLYLIIYAVLAFVCMWITALVYPVPELNDGMVAFFMIAPAIATAIIIIAFKRMGKAKESAQTQRFDETYLLEWQNAVVEGSQNKLICSEHQLQQITTQQAENDLRIIHDCVQLTQSTLDPDVFFMRLDLLVEKSEHLCTLEKYISFSGASPKDAYNQVIEQRQEAIKQFLIRYATDCFDKAEALKTAKGKLGRYQKFYDSLQPYYEIMDTDNIDYIETKYKAYVSIATQKD